MPTTSTTDPAIHAHPRRREVRRRKMTAPTRVMRYIASSASVPSVDMYEKTLVGESKPCAATTTTVIAATTASAVVGVCFDVLVLPSRGEMNPSRPSAYSRRVAPFIVATTAPKALRTVAAPRTGVSEELR